MAKKAHGETRALKHFAPKPKVVDELARAKAQGQAQFDSIKEMVEALRACDPDDDRAREDAERAIHEDALSVQVRSGWHQPGSDDNKPAEYEILLSTGGPACRIIGELSEHGEPTSAHLEVQDWFQPWTEIRAKVAEMPENAGREFCYSIGELLASVSP